MKKLWKSIDPIISTLEYLQNQKLTWSWITILIWHLNTAAVTVDLQIQGHASFLWPFISPSVCKLSEKPQCLFQHHRDYGSQWHYREYWEIRGWFPSSRSCAIFTWRFISPAASVLSDRSRCTYFHVFKVRDYVEKDTEKYEMNIYTLCEIAHDLVFEGQPLL